MTGETKGAGREAFLTEEIFVLDITYTVQKSGACFDTMVGMSVVFNLAPHTKQPLIHELVENHATVHERKKSREVSLDKAMTRRAKNQAFDCSISSIFCYCSCYFCILQHHIKAIYLLEGERYTAKTEGGRNGVGLNLHPCECRSNGRSQE